MAMRRVRTGLLGAAAALPTPLTPSYCCTDERSALEQWLASHPRTDPKSNVEHPAPLTFAPDVALAEAICNFRARHAASEVLYL